jgi:hypothetical protein
MTDSRHRAAAVASSRIEFMSDAHSRGGAKCLNPEVFHVFISDVEHFMAQKKMEFLDDFATVILLGGSRRSNTGNHHYLHGLRHSERKGLLRTWFVSGTEQRGANLDACLQHTESNPPRFRAIERNQHPLTQAARDRETTESFRRGWYHRSPGNTTHRVARDAEIRDQRHATTPKVVARTGDRTRKGRRLSTPAFRITRR